MKNTNIAAKIGMGFQANLKCGKENASVEEVKNKWEHEFHIQQENLPETLEINLKNRALQLLSLYSIKVYSGN